MNEHVAIATLPAVQPPRRTEVRVVSDPIPVLDTGRFEHMQRIANVMAHSSLVPDALCKIKDGNDMVPLDPQEIISNCFLVTNQAVRWGMDPFAVAQCVSVVKGKLCYEGKLIAAVLDAKLGIELEYEITGQGEAMKVVVSGAIDGKPVNDSKGKPKIVEGTVGDWKTTGPGSPWGAKGGYTRMLRYRGAREWARVHAPSIMLGVYSDDEMEAMADERRGRGAQEVIVREEPPAPPPPPQIAAPVAAQPEAAPAAIEADDGPPDPITTLPAAAPKQPATPTPADGAAWIAWLTDKFAAFENYEAGEAYWNDTIQALDLPDLVQEDAMGVWRRFERRFEA